MKNCTIILLFFLLILWNPELYGQSANTSLSNLSNPTAINADLLPQQNGLYNLGSPGINWLQIYCGSLNLGSDGGIYYQGDKLISSSDFTNLWVGLGSGLANTTGISNTAVGTGSLGLNTTGPYNTAIGNGALAANSTGNSNTAIGDDALYQNNEGSSNTAIGSQTLVANKTGCCNNAIGWGSLLSNTTGSANTANGYYSMAKNTSGYSNNATGYWSLSANTIGFENAAYGEMALSANTTGYDNVAIGNNALGSNNSGHGNIAIGVSSLLDNFTGQKIVAIGGKADVTSDGLINSIVIGHLATVNASDKVVIGNNSITVIGGQVGWSTFADGRFKTNVRENVPGLQFIKKLKPVTYQVEARKFEEFLGRPDNLINELSASYDLSENRIRTGFIAQDVEVAAKETGYDFDGINVPQNDKDNYSLVYSDFIPSLVKAVQELSSRNDSLQNEIDELKAASNSRQSVISFQSSDSQNDKSDVTNSQSAALYQNLPNPFNHTTVIPFHVPRYCQSASIMIMITATGEVMTVLPISCDQDHVQIDAAPFSNGNYSYSLFVNGQLIATKQMTVMR